MGFKWFNCKTEPPHEDKSKLLLTDGEKLYTVSYYRNTGFLDPYTQRSLPRDWLNELWWSDNSIALSKITAIGR